eukprot:g32613.t1
MMLLFVGIFFHLLGVCGRDSFPRHESDKRNKPFYAAPSYSDSHHSRSRNDGLFSKRAHGNIGVSLRSQSTETRGDIRPVRSPVGHFNDDFKPWPATRVLRVLTSSSKDDFRVLIKATKKSGTTWLECLLEASLKHYCEGRADCTHEGQSRNSSERGFVISPGGRRIRFGPVTTKHIHDVPELVTRHLRRANNVTLVNIVRDPRDTVVSKFRWFHPTSTEDMPVPHEWIQKHAGKTVTDMAIQKHAGKTVTDMAYFYKECTHLNRSAASCYLVTYEDLKIDAVGELARLGRLLRLDGPAFKAAVQYAATQACSVETMKDQEQNGTLQYGRWLARKRIKVQRGTTQDFLYRLLPEDVTTLNQLAIDTFSQAGDHPWLLQWFLSLPNVTPPDTLSPGLRKRALESSCQGLVPRKLRKYVFWTQGLAESKRLKEWRAVRKK